VFGADAGAQPAHGRGGGGGGARRRAIEALRRFPILGVRTNIGFLIELLEHPRFISGDIDTAFLDSAGDTFASRSAPAEVAPPFAAVALAAGPPAAAGTVGAPPAAGAGHADPWISLRGVRV
jgi:acetyl/propionyl-CoA carboxylase alpha subunit